MLEPSLVVMKHDILMVRHDILMFEALYFDIKVWFTNVEAWYNEMRKWFTDVRACFTYIGVMVINWDHTLFMLGWCLLIESMIYWCWDMVFLCLRHGKLIWEQFIIVEVGILIWEHDFPKLNAASKAQHCTPSSTLISRWSRFTSLYQGKI